MIFSPSSDCWDERLFADDVTSRRDRRRGRSKCAGAAVSRRSRLPASIHRAAPRRSRIRHVELRDCAFHPLGVRVARSDHRDVLHLRERREMHLVSRFTAPDYCDTPELHCVAFCLDLSVGRSGLRASATIERPKGSFMWFAIATPSIRSIPRLSDRAHPDWALALQECHGIHSGFFDALASRGISARPSSAFARLRIRSRIRPGSAAPADRRGAVFAKVVRGSSTVCGHDWALVRSTRYPPGFNTRKNSLSATQVARDRVGGAESRRTKRRGLANDRGSGRFMTSPCATLEADCSGGI